MITIIIIDDHKVLRQGIRMLLEIEADFQVVGEAAGGIEGLKLVGRVKPDVALVDIMLDGMNGIELTEHIRDVAPVTRVIMLSMLNSVSYVRRALEAGAKGYVVKGEGVEELIAAIRIVYAGGQFLSSSLEKD